MDAGRPVKSPMQPIRRSPAKAGDTFRATGWSYPGYRHPQPFEASRFAYEQDHRRPGSRESSRTAMPERAGVKPPLRSGSTSARSGMESNNAHPLWNGS